MNKEAFICDNLDCLFEWETDLDIDQHPDMCPKCLTHSTHCKGLSIPSEKWENLKRGSEID